MYINKLNDLGKNKIPFLVIISYDKKVVEIIEYPNKSDNVYFDIDSSTNKSDTILFDKIKPINFDTYRSKFDMVIELIKSGETYLLNLTAPTNITTSLSLKDIYNTTKAKFKLYYKDKFVCFSPERFIKIQNNTIYTYPMKGTINANIPNAKELILSDSKELAEHTMVVDLLRNDLSIVSNKVTVTKFRYLEKINAGSRELYQVSSEIKGELEEGWRANIGNILNSLLPAGSITGTPKKNTVKIINDIEGYDRGFFSGVFGYFDGESFDSGVMIRFIEKDGDKFIYKSGGGITIDSNAKKEYEELIAKIYLPC
ncbi:aminodeoxychorismate synthase component I [Arcobacter sp. FWKO B]|nr:aminodeoxychorismate synthase component I [Arcobacter sp. FWKO B]